MTKSTNLSAIGLSLEDQEEIIRGGLKRIALDRDKEPFGISTIQRHFQLGFNTASRVKDFAIKAGFVRVSKLHPWQVKFNFDDE